MDAHDAGVLNKLGKQAAPLLARTVNTRLLRNPVRLAGIYLDIVQGKGSGTGWDMAGEVSAALAFLAGIADPVVMDVGANRGEWTRGIFEALGTGRYFAYEPQSACQDSLRSLRIPDITIVQACLSDKQGEMDLHSDSAGSGLASLYERAETYLAGPTRVERVPVTTVDEQLATQKIDEVDFMKIDVEGAELQVLRGAKAALESGAIRAFAFEFGSANIYSHAFFRDFWDLLSARKYQLWRIVPGGGLRPVPAYREDLEHFRGVSNYVAALTAPKPLQ